MEIVWSSFATEGLFSILEYVETDFGSRVSQRVYTDIMGYIETLTKFLTRVFMMIYFLLKL